MILPRPIWIVLLAVVIVTFLPTWAAQSSDSISRNGIPQYSPCTAQPRSVKELGNSFAKGRIPSPVDLTGTWVAIGFLGASTSLNCTGVKRGQKFEWVMIAKRYSVEIDMIGSYSQKTAFKPDREGNLALAVDFEGDDIPIYRCRLTQRNTLACLIGAPPREDGVEFKKMPAAEDEIFRDSGAQ